MSAGRRPTARSRLLRLQRRIYRQLEREAEGLLGPQPPSIRAYARECERDFRAVPSAGRNASVTKAELIAAIRRHDVTFIGDYHSFAQSQRTALRLMREAARPGERWALGVELIPSQYQRALDEFQAGRLTAAQFRRKVRYQEHWGFPWAHYEPLFTWARRHHIRLVALNRPRALVYGESARDLHARDQWAAGILTDLLAEEPGLRIFVLYGGLHVGRAHLPRELERVSRAFIGRPCCSLSIHQNHPGLYWSLARRGRELETQVVRLRNRSAYCVLSATPWAQLQSQIASAEGESLEEDDDAPTDYLSLMSAYGAVIAEFLGLDPIPFSSLTIRTIEDADFIDRGDVATRLGEEERRLAHALVEANERFYLPASQLAYLASPSQNSAAELAAIHLLRRTVRVRKPSRPDASEDFFRDTLESAFGFLGSLILNPRRKCDLPKDHLTRLAHLARGSRPAFLGEVQARHWAVGVLSAGRRAATLREIERAVGGARGRLAAWHASRYTGRAFAKRLHPVLLRARHGSSAFAEVIALFLQRKNFEAAFRQLENVCGAASGDRRTLQISKTESI